MSEQIALHALQEAVLALHGTVLAIGDVMLDVFTYGECTRISPEAPIPVLRVTREVRMLGGVGNVARNVAALGGSTILLAPIGEDADGGVLEELLEAEPQIQNELLRCRGRETTAKRRLIASAQQMLRVDKEHPMPLAAADEEILVERALAALSTVTAIILSDYGKGTLTPSVIERVMAAAAAAGKPVFVDPKSRDMARYAGATCITPNARELAEATGLRTETDEEVAAAARAVLAASGARYVLATRSEKGMSLVAQDGTALHIPARKRDVFDVSGAGDTVIGTLAFAVGSAIDWDTAAGLANFTAGVVVAKPGTATCSIEELDVEVADVALGLGTKLVAPPQATRLAAQWRRLGLRVGFTNGCFDLLHPGHVSLLKRAREGCDRLIVGLNSDDSVQRLKGPTRPLQNQAARAAVLAALAAVDLVVIFGEDTPIELIRSVRPSVLLKGADYSIATVVGADLVIADGGEVKLIELVEGQSTTGIIARMG